jgi:hypothetical protein
MTPDAMVGGICAKLHNERRWWCEEGILESPIESKKRHVERKEKEHETVLTRSMPLANPLVSEEQCKSQGRN